MFAMSYYGANRVVPNYNVMGPVKAALEAVCRYLAYELGPRKLRVHAISPGPLKTRAASGLKDFDRMLNSAAAKSPIGECVDIKAEGIVNLGTVRGGGRMGVHPQTLLSSAISQ